MTAIHLLAAYGLCLSLMLGKIPLPQLLVRIPWVGGFFERMFQCPLCTGFHCGWVVWLMEAARHGEYPSGGVADAILWAFASAGFCYIIDAAVQWIERRLDV